MLRSARAFYSISVLAYIILYGDPRYSVAASGDCDGLVDAVRVQLFNWNNELAWRGRRINWIYCDRSFCWYCEHCRWIPQSGRHSKKLAEHKIRLDFYWILEVVNELPKWRRQIAKLRVKTFIDIVLSTSQNSFNKVKSTKHKY